MPNKPAPRRPDKRSRRPPHGAGSGAGPRGKKFEKRPPRGARPAIAGGGARPAAVRSADAEGEPSETVGAVPEGERLQKVLASAGIASRRECESLITEGRVEVDGQVVSELGARVNRQTQDIRVDGEALPRPRLVYFAVHKPPGVVTTARDPAGRPRVIDLLPPSVGRVFTVGRLDLASEGLIILTNDGEMANQLAHPKHGVEKTYEVQVAGHPDPDVLAQLRRGVHLSEGYSHAVHARIKSKLKKSALLEMVLDEGRNREVRRLLARVGHKVQRLTRVAVGPVRLGDMPRGAYRALTQEEVRKLRETIAAGPKSGEEPRESRAPSRGPRPSRPPMGQRPAGGRPAGGGRPAAGRPVAGGRPGGAGRPATGRAAVGRAAAGGAAAGRVSGGRPAAGKRFERKPRPATGDAVEDRAAVRRILGDDGSGRPMPEDAAPASTGRKRFGKKSVAKKPYGRKTTGGGAAAGGRAAEGRPAGGKPAFRKTKGTKVTGRKPVKRRRPERPQRGPNKP